MTPGVVIVGGGHAGTRCAHALRQAGYAGTAALWNDMSRGAPLWINGPDENARRIGINPLLSGERSEDEGLFVRQHEYWVSVMRQALAEENNGVVA